MNNVSITLDAMVHDGTRIAATELLEARVIDGTAAPCVFCGATIQGHINIQAQAQFTALVVVHRIATDAGATVEGSSHTPLARRTGTHAPYKAEESIRIPFALQLNALPASSYEGDVRRVCHAIVATAVDGLPGPFGNNTDLVVERPIFVQSPADSATPSAAAEVSVHDCGGEVRLKLDCGEHLPLGGVAHARVTASVTERLRRVVVKLLAVEGADGTPPRVVREVEAWRGDAQSMGDLERDGGVAVTLDLRAGFSAEAAAEGISDEPVGPSIPPVGLGGETVEVRHWLRLVVEPVEGNEAWNTLPVTVGNAGTALVGAPPGTLGTIAPRASAVRRGAGGAADEGTSWSTLIFLLLLFFQRPLSNYLLPALGIRPAVQPQRAHFQQHGFEQGGFGRPGFDGRGADYRRGIPGFNVPLQQGAPVRTAPWGFMDGRSNGFGAPAVDDEDYDEDDAAEVWVEGKGWVRA